MSCRSCETSRHSPEYHRQSKPESNSGCGGRGENNCSAESNAIPGSPLYEWEQENGKLIYESNLIHGKDGRFMWTYKKFPCPPEKKKRRTCCSLTYRVNR